MKSRRHLAATTAVLLALSVALTACQSNANPSSNQATSATASQAPTPSDPPATPEPPSDEEQGALAVQEYAKLYSRALRTGKIDFKALDRIATENLYFAVQKDVQSAQAFGHTAKGRLRYELDPAKTSGERMTIGGCEDRSGFTRYTADGKEFTYTLPNGEPATDRLRVKFTLNRVDQLWKIDKMTYTNKVIAC